MGIASADEKANFGASPRESSLSAAEFLAARGRAAAACKRWRWIGHLQRGLSECGRMKEEEEEEDV